MHAPEERPRPDLFIAELLTDRTAHVLAVSHRKEDRLLMHAPEERPRPDLFIAELLLDDLGLNADGLVEHDTVHPVDVALVADSVWREVEPLDALEQLRVKPADL